MSSRGSLFKRSSRSELFFTFISGFYRAHIKDFDKHALFSASVLVNDAHFLVIFKIEIFSKLRTDPVPFQYIAPGNCFCAMFNYSIMY
jgi:hypothetical protein